jgi:hypothetical protein
MKEKSMKSLLISICTLLPVISGLSAMEITDITKKSVPFKLAQQSQDILPLVPQDKSLLWTYHIDKLSTTARALIYTTAFETSQENAEKLAALPTKKLLRFFYETQPHLPLMMENKILTAFDVFLLTPEQRTVLLPIKNNKFFSYKAETEELIIPQEASSFCSEDVIDVVTAVNIGSVAGCATSSFWWIPGVGPLSCMLIPAIAATSIYCLDEACND